MIHIFRFEGDKIIESWEASQEALEDSSNEFCYLIAKPFVIRTPLIFVTIGRPADPTPFF